VLIGIATTEIDHVVEDAKAAELAGFDFVGCGDHLFFHGPTPNPFVLLAAAAGATQRIRLLSSVALLPLYPAALAAKLAVTLDRVSGGRFEFGVGAGGEFPPEFEAAGVDPGSRFRRLDEALRMIRALFTGEPTTFVGEFATVRDLALKPAPVQPGGPPIWLGGRKEGAMRRAGRYADIWMPYMIDPKGLAKGLARVREHAIESGRAESTVTGAIYVWTCVDDDGDRARRVGTEVVSHAYGQDFAPLADRYLVLGTPQEVTGRLAEFAEAGATRAVIQPACPPAQRTAMVDLFAGHVLPELRPAA
jgi:probable F420-dependent oxidoreductase